MLRKFLATAIIAATALEANASLTTGDIAFTSFNADEDGWALTTFKDIDANTTIYFTDNEWNGLTIGSGGAFNTGESYHQWNTGTSSIAAGTVIRFSAIDSATNLAASIGSLSRSSVSGSNNYGMSATAETIYAYLGTSVNQATAFLSAISSGQFSIADGQLANTGLVAGLNAVQLSSGTDYAEYIGLRSGLANFDDYKSLVANVANWDDKGDGSFASLVPNPTSFSVAAVPLPAAGWMFMSVAGLFGAVSRSRTAAK